MRNTVLVPLLGLVIFVFYKIVTSIALRRQNAAKAQELGCREPADVPGGGFLGWKHLKAFIDADKAQRFPDFLLERHEWMTKEHGRVCETFRTGFLGQTIYFTSDPKNIQAMLATQFQDFELGPTRAAVMGGVLGDGIFVQDGKKWEHSRAMLRPNFVRDQVSDLDMEEIHVKNLLEVMPTQASGWTDFVNIQTLFFRLTIDASTEFLFGESVLSQVAAKTADGKPNARDEVVFSQNFDRATYHMARKFRFADNHWLYNPSELKRNSEKINDLVKTYVDAALAKPIADEKEKAEKYIFLDALTQQTRDPDEIRAQLLNILLAGRDTTASLLSWFIYEMLRNPEVFEKLRSIIIENFGTFDDPQDITFATLKSCQYLQYCINETLRLWPVVPGNERRSNKPTSLPRGGGPDGNSPIFIPADTAVDYSVHVLHRRRDIWGEDAGVFRPERFQGLRPAWTFIPFNAGPRICIGQQFALTEASYVVVRLLQKFDKIEAAPSELEQPALSNLTLTNCPAFPVTLRLHEAK
ncbi:cytochrome p450 like protein [Zymoseptoria brevis]|uniref:Cytochrome p450 like protein n=1 Tax=Zymoseptoria brevis TaxID=1047168 RepID=A0A0F4G7Z8_9PEZI|nr:cytochrome p450 like protein [Zymoseptoria brevis]